MLTAKFHFYSKGTWPTDEVRSLHTCACRKPSLNKTMLYMHIRKYDIPQQYCVQNVCDAWLFVAPIFSIRPTQFTEARRWNLLCERGRATRSRLTNKTCATGFQPLTQTFDKRNHGYQQTLRLPNTGMHKSRHIFNRRCPNNERWHKFPPRSWRYETWHG